MVAADYFAIRKEEDKYVVHLVWVVARDLDIVVRPIYLDAKLKHRTLKTIEGSG